MSQTMTHDEESTKGEALLGRVRSVLPEKPSRKGFLEVCQFVEEVAQEDMEWSAPKSCTTRLA